MWFFAWGFGFCFVLWLLLLVLCIVYGVVGFGCVACLICMFGVLGVARACCLDAGWMAQWVRISGWFRWFCLLWLLIGCFGLVVVLVDWLVVIFGIAGL